MVTRQVIFTFPSELVEEPLIYYLGQKFNITTSIRRADVSENKGWVVLELEGEEKDIERGLVWMAGKGVRVDPVSGDLVEG
ncbi:MAG: NIL domain-containing protein [Dehalococcoidales bacterium]|nr:NIL domain-containing protein [Dehalococcoidales bacterium]